MTTWWQIRAISSRYSSLCIYSETNMWMDKNTNGSIIFNRIKIPLIFSWAITIHKYQGRMLGWDIKDLEESEQCCGMTLFVLFQIFILMDLLFKPIIFWTIENGKQFEPIDFYTISHWWSFTIVETNTESIRRFTINMIF